MTDYLMEHDLITMNPEIKRRWVGDLRSGRFKQGRRALNFLDSGQSCCLGVLSLAAAQDSIVNTRIRSDAAGRPRLAYGSELEGWSDTQLTGRVCRWAGIMHSDEISASGRMPFLDRHGNSVYLDALNDDGFTFDQIADLIQMFY